MHLNMYIQVHIQMHIYKLYMHLELCTDFRTTGLFTNSDLIE